MSHASCPSSEILESSLVLFLLDFPLFPPTLQITPRFVDESHRTDKPPHPDTPHAAPRGRLTKAANRKQLDDRILPTNGQDLSHLTGGLLAPS